MSTAGTVSFFYIYVKERPFVKLNFRNVIPNGPLILRGPRGHAIPVELIRLGNRTYLGAGWVQFRAHNRIVTGDILRCELNQQRIMSVQICSQAADTEMYVRSRPKEEKHGRNLVEETSKGESFRGENDWRHEEKHAKRWILQEKHEDLGMDLKRDHMNYEEQEKLHLQRLDCRHEEKHANRQAHKDLNKKHTHVKYEEQESLDMQLRFRRNPSFSIPIIWSRANGGLCHIPSKYVHYMPGVGSKFTLIGPDGHRTKVRRTTQYSIGSGWPAFRERYGLGLGNQICFEIIRKQSVWKVHIS